MSESNRQQKNPYPHGRGVGSVPVLFSLRNVQPSIVSGIANSKTNATAAGEHPLAKSPVATSVASSVALPETSPTPSQTSTKNNSKNNWTYNAVVGLLILAVCFLVIRNTQGTNANAKGTTQTLNVNKPLEAGPSLASVPAPVISNGPPALPELAKSSIEFVLSPNSPSPVFLPEPNVNPESTVAGQSLVQAKPPMLLQSAQLETLDANSPTAESSNIGNNLAESGFLFPEPRVASNPDSRPTSSTSTLSKQPVTEGSPQANASSNLARGNMNASSPGIVDTGSPTMTTRELIDLHERGKQYFPQNTFNNPSLPKGTTERGTPASPISNTAPFLENSQSNVINALQSNDATDSRLMSGRAYPPMSKEYPALTIPAYEQNALGGRPVVANPTQPLQLIHQPANGSNRYPGYVPQPLTSPIPYTSIAPPQGGNSTGYPPGN